MYEYESIEDILNLCRATELPFWEVVLCAEEEREEMPRSMIVEEASRRIQIFRDSVRIGLDDEGKTPSGMSGGDAVSIRDTDPLFLGTFAHAALSFAMAVSEANAKMYRVVACPTAGSCGIMPGCFVAMETIYRVTEEQLLRGFFAAAGIGNVITNVAGVAGAVGGCQAECGSAAAMAAGGIVAVMGGTPEQIANAATLALKNVLGLVCDPVAGLVEVPCIKRNGMHAVHAITAAEMALAGVKSVIPADEVILAMKYIGAALPSSLRETSEGGLAVTSSALAIAEKVRNL